LRIRSFLDCSMISCPDEVVPAADRRRAMAENAESAPIGALSETASVEVGTPLS
jgi:hypothetical protein